MVISQPLSPSGLSLPANLGFWAGAVLLPLGLSLVPWILRRSPELVAENIANLLLANVCVTLTGVMNGSPIALVGMEASQFTASLVLLTVASFMGFGYAFTVQNSVNDVVFWKRVVEYTAQRRFIQRLSLNRPQPVFPRSGVVTAFMVGIAVVAMTIGVFAAAISR